MPSISFLNMYQFSKHNTDKNVGCGLIVKLDKSLSWAPNWTAKQPVNTIR